MLCASLIYPSSTYSASFTHPWNTKCFFHSPIKVADGRLLPLNTLLVPCHFEARSLVTIKLWALNRTHALVEKQLNNNSVCVAATVTELWCVLQQQWPSCGVCCSNSDRVTKCVAATVTELRVCCSNSDRVTKCVAATVTEMRCVLQQQWPRCGVCCSNNDRLQSAL